MGGRGREIPDNSDGNVAVCSKICKLLFHLTILLNLQILFHLHAIMIQKINVVLLSYLITGQ